MTRLVGHMNDGGRREKCKITFHSVQGKASFLVPHLLGGDSAILASLPNVKQLQHIKLISELNVACSLYLQLLDLDLAHVELLPELDQLLVLEHQLLLQSLRHR